MPSYEYSTDRVIPSNEEDIKSPSATGRKEELIELL